MAEDLYPNDAALKDALTPAQVVAMTIWGESRDQQIEGQVAVGCVIRNRVLRPQRFSDDWKGVCLARRQFSCWLPLDGPSNYMAVMRRVADSLAGHTPWPQQALWIAEGVIGGHITDRTGGATHYYVTVTKTPKWALNLKPCAVIGAHSFFSNVD